MKSGNGTASKQHLYILWHVPLIFLFKIGVTGNMRARLKEINETTFGYAVPIVFPRLWGAYYIEQFLLGILWPLKYPLNGSGGSEWRILGIIALPIVVLFWAVQFLFWFLVALLIIWLCSGQPDEPIKAILRLIF